MSNNLAYDAGFKDGANAGYTLGKDATITKFKELFEAAEAANTWINNHFSDPPLCSGDYRGEECKRLNTVISEVGQLIKKLP